MTDGVVLKQASRVCHLCTPYFRQTGFLRYSGVLPCIPKLDITYKRLLTYLPTYPDIRRKYPQITYLLFVIFRKLDVDCDIFKKLRYP